MIALFLSALISCSSLHKEAVVKTDLPITGSICFDGFIRQYVELPCEERIVNDGPLGSKIFICKLGGKKAPINFLVIENYFSERFFIGSIICRDEATSIFFYQNKEI